MCTRTVLYIQWHIAFKRVKGLQFWQNTPVTVNPSLLNIKTVRIKVVFELN